MNRIHSHEFTDFFCETCQNDDLINYDIKCTICDSNDIICFCIHCCDYFSKDKEILLCRFKTLREKEIVAFSIINKFIKKRKFVKKLELYSLYILDEYLNPDSNFIKHKFSKYNKSKQICYINSYNKLIFYKIRK